MENRSEVARLRRQIELEYQAANRVFNEPSITSRHDFIEQRQANLGSCFEELTQYMSKEEAIQIFVDVAEGIGNEKNSASQAISQPDTPNTVIVYS